MKREPKVFIDPEAKQKLDLYIELTPEEVSGLGKVNIVDGDKFLISDIILFKQDSNFGETELDTKALSLWLEELAKKGENPALYKVWWHSHVNMKVYWSSVDEATIERFKNTQWLISIVGNKKGEYLVRLDIFQPVRLTIDELELQISLKENSRLREQIKKEIAEKIRHRPSRKATWIGEKRDWPTIKRDWGYI